MAQVNADPDKLRAFASQLGRAAEQMGQIAREMKRGLDATGWSDSERAKFEALLNDTTRQLQSFGEQVKTQYVPTLQRKASALDQFRR